MPISGVQTIGPTSKTVATKKTEPKPHKNITNERVKEERRNPPKDMGKEVKNNRDGDSSAIG